MLVGLKKENFLDSIIILFYFLFFAGLFFSLRAVCSITIGCLLIAGLIKQNGSFSKIFDRRKTTFFIIACTFFFLLQFTPLLLADQQMYWINVQMKVAIVFIRLHCSAGKFDKKKWQLLWQGYCLLLAAALLCCMISAIVLFSQNNDNSVFFYHALLKPLHHHAVYFSIYVFVAFIVLMESIRRQSSFFTPLLNYVLLLLFTVSLVLLSSKLVILMLLTSLIYYTFHFFTQTILHKKIITGIIIGSFLLVGTILITRNPVSERFREILSGDLALVKKEQFNPGIYFTGAQIRLLQWRFVPEILNKQQAWWTGVSPFKAQKLLDEKYISTNMYIGEPARGDHGFLGFNNHDQFLASLLQTGIPGAIAFLLIIVALIRVGWQQRKTGYLFIFLLLLIYSFMESVFETQFGIALFTFFPVFLLQEE
jgi:hypothetical protein